MKKDYPDALIMLLSGKEGREIGDSCIRNSLVRRRVHEGAVLEPNEAVWRVIS